MPVFSNPPTQPLPGANALDQEQAQQRADTAAQTQQQFQNLAEAKPVTFPGSFIHPEPPVPMPDFGHPEANHIFNLLANRRK